MAGASASPVYYFVPEDGDDELHPNVFSLGSGGSSKPKLGEVKQAFPLPGGYHFRFKKAFKGTYVWLDVLDDGDAVPSFNGQILAKVSRLAAPRGGASGFSQSAGSTRPRPTVDGASHGVEAATGQQERSFFRSDSAGSQQSRSGKNSSGDLLGLHSPTNPSSTATAAAASTPIHPEPSAFQTIPPSNAAQSSSAVPTQSSGEGRSSGASTPLVKPPPHARSSSGMTAPSGSVSSSSSGPAGALHGMDWSSVPSPAPSPPLVPQAAPPMRNGMGSVPTRSTSPLKKQQQQQQQQTSKQNLQVPSDLSAAAKDFKL